MHSLKVRYLNTCSASLLSRRRSNQHKTENWHGVSDCKFSLEGERSQNQQVALTLRNTLEPWLICELGLHLLGAIIITLPPSRPLQLVSIGELINPFLMVRRKSWVRPPASSTPVCLRPSLNFNFPITHYSRPQLLFTLRQMHLSINPRQVPRRTQLLACWQ